MDNLNLLANTTVAMLKKDPIEVPTNQVLCNSPIDILKTLDTYGVAVIALQCDNKKLLKLLRIQSSIILLMLYLKMNLRFLNLRWKKN